MWTREREAHELTWRRQLVINLTRDPVSDQWALHLALPPSVHCILPLVSLRSTSSDGAGTYS